MIKTNSWRRGLCMALAGLLLCNMSGCMLLPKEEEEKNVSFVKADNLEQYALIMPERMDLEKIVDIPCIYRQMQEESLSFKEDKQLVEHVFVSTGDSVKKGTLLATLRTGDIEQEIKLLDNSIGQMKRKIEEVKLQASYEKKYVELEYEHKHITKVERKQRIVMIEDNLKDDIASKEDEMYIQTLRQKEKKETLARSRIYAPMDGVISYVKVDLENSYSEENVEVMKMVNPEKCAFEIFVSEDSSYLKEGQTYSVDCEGTSYEGSLLPVEKKDQSFIYLQVKGASLNLKVGQNGSIHYRADSRMNALVLPTSIIHEGQGYLFVYVLSKDNIKSIHKVEVGLKTAEYTEITNGLIDNDLVINE